MAEQEWYEVSRALTEKRHELTLTGADINERLEQTQLDERIFQLLELNFLEISHLSLTKLPDGLANLTKLKNLALQGNQLEEVPNGLASLKLLTFLDLSDNKLECLVAAINECSSLYRLNVSCNQLKALPEMGNLKQLAVVHLDNNALSKLPDSLFSLPHLAEIYSSKNKISSLPSEVSNLKSLKILDLTENCLTEIPVELADCSKLKELKLQNNPLKDNRLKKMASQCSTKAIITYLLQQDSSKGKGKKGKKKKGKEENEHAEDSNSTKRKIFVNYNNDGKTVVTRKSGVKSVREHIMCVLIKGLDLEDPSIFKKFISLQTKAHEQVCEYRTIATIATHNFALVNMPLEYNVRSPDELKIIPLGKKEAVSAEQLMQTLHEEKLKEKQKKKRQVKTGLYRYLDLLEGHDTYAFVSDATGSVISLPPITNSESTKISSEIGDVLVEVTSSVSLPKCKMVMEYLLHELFKDGFESVTLDSDGNTERNGLSLEQVRVIDENGALLNVFPSNVDLDLGESVSVVRSE